MCSQEKQISCALKKYQKDILNSKIKILITTISIHKPCDHQEKQILCGLRERQ